MVFCFIFHAFILLLQGKLILKLSRSECMNWIKNKYCSYCLRFSLLSSYFCFCSFLCIFSLIIFFVDFILECTSLVKTSGPPFFGVFLLATTFEKNMAKVQLFRSLLVNLQMQAYPEYDMKHK